MQHKSQKQPEDIYNLTHLAIQRMRQCALEEQKSKMPKAVSLQRESSRHA